jgi:hypothetical protein
MKQNYKKKNKHFCQNTRLMTILQIRHKRGPFMFVWREKHVWGKKTLPLST